MQYFESCFSNPEEQMLSQLNWKWGNKVSSLSCDHQKILRWLSPLQTNNIDPGTHHVLKSSLDLHNNGRENTNSNVFPLWWATMLLSPLNKQCLTPKRSQNATGELTHLMVLCIQSCWPPFTKLMELIWRGIFKTESSVWSFYFDLNLNMFWED